MAAFRFIDLFAGIGGLRIPFESLGGDCVFSSEIDKFARQTYQANFDEEPHGDITLIPELIICSAIGEPISPGLISVIVFKSSVLLIFP